MNKTSLNINDISNQYIYRIESDNIRNTIIKPNLSQDVNNIFKSLNNRISDMILVVNMFTSSYTMPAQFDLEIICVEKYYSFIAEHISILKMDKIIYHKNESSIQPNWFYNDQNDLIIPISNLSNNELFKPLIELYKTNWIMFNLNSQTLFVMSHQDVNSLYKIPKDKIELICSVMPFN